jgi:hypothetical protein
MLGACGFWHPLFCSRLCSQAADEGRGQPGRSRRRPSAPRATSTILATEEEKWKGRWREGNAAGQSEGIFTLTVAPDGSVAGKGRGEQVVTGGGSASFPVEIEGTRDEQAFDLTLTSAAGSLDVEATIEGDTAKGPWRTGAGQQAYNGRITLECVSCP